MLTTNSIPDLSDMPEPLDLALRMASLKRAHRVHRRVAFLIHSPETFSALEPVIEELQARSDRFELLFFALARNYTGQEGSLFEGLRETFLYLREKGLRPVALRGHSIDDLLSLMRLAPDFVFRQSPWDKDIPPYFASHFLGFANLCYVPYGLMTVEQPELQYDQPFHNACDLIFCESGFHEHAYATHRSLGGIGVHATGYPRFQTLLAAMRAASHERDWPIPEAGVRPRLIWAPHHSVEDTWLGFSTFLEHKDLMLKEARRGRVSILFRPHPALLPRLKATGLMTEEDYLAYENAFNATGTSKVDVAKDYARTFAVSDILITDGVGFFSEYLLTGKPLVRTMRQGSCQLNQFGAWLVEACRNVHDSEQLQTVLDQVAERRYDDDKAPLRQERQQRMHALAEGAAARIVDILENT